MSAHVSGFSAAASAPRAAAAPGLLRAAIDAVLEWPQRRAVRAELAALTDRELADVGLSRGDLPRVFDAGFASTHAIRRAF